MPTGLSEFVLRADRWGLIAMLATVGPTAAVAQVAPPTVTDIRIGRDTVSLYALEHDYASTETRVGRIVRATGAWVAGDDRRRPVPAYMPTGRHGAVRLGSDLRLVGRERVKGQSWFRSYSIVDATGRVHPLEAALPLRDRWHLFLASDSTRILWRDEPPAACADPTRWTVDRQAIWFACGNGADLGILLRVDRATGRTTAVTGEGVASTAIVGLAETRKAVWVLGQRNLSGGMTDSGLFRFDLSARTWSRIRRDAGAWPAGHPTALAAVGDSLWVAMEDGIAIYDERRNTWTGRWYHAGMVIDTTEDDRAAVTIRASARFTLAPSPPAAEEARARLRIAIAERLIDGPLREDDSGARSVDSIAAVIRDLPAAHLDRALAQPDHVFERALAYPSLLAIATARWLNADSSLDTWDSDVIESIGFLGDPAYLPIVRRVWDHGGVDYLLTPVLAFTLTRFGDSTGLHWLQRRVVTARAAEEFDLIAAALASVGDTTGGPALAALFDSIDADDRDGPAILLREVARTATRSQWLATFGHLSASDVLRRALLDRFYASALDSLVRSDSGTRASALAVVHRELGTPGGDGLWAAADLAVACGDTGAIPYLLPLLARTPRDYRIAHTTLIQLTGVEAAPTRQSEARRFWEQWWATHRAGFTPVPAAVGQLALVRWRVRALGLLP
jgi:hypothetical protein